MQRDLSDLVVIFDLDGTLVDSAPDLTDAMNAVLEAEGLSRLPEQTVRHLVGDGARALLVRGHAENGRDFPDGAAGDALVARFIAHYQENIAVRTRPFAGAEDCLGQLGAAGASLAVCTNKPHALAVSVLGELSLLDRFDVVLGRDSLDRFKPDPAPLFEIIARTERNQAVMVGDTITDLAAARAADIPAFLASFGYGTGGGRPELPLQKREQRFESFEALFDMIATVSS